MSSDLYSPSEPELLEAHCQGGSFQTDHCQHSSADADIEGEESGYSETMQGLDSAGEDTSRPSSAAAGTTVGVTSEPSLKRKRDEQIESERNGKEHTIQSLQKGQQSSWNFDGFDPSKGSLSQEQVIGDLEDTSKLKRSKPNPSPLKATKEKSFSCNISALPAAIWQHVFCFVPPVFLGRLMRVNRAFNSYLTRTEFPKERMPPAHSILQPLSAEAVWVASRRRFAPGLPRSIRGLREVDMWRLLIGRNCQICGHTGAADPAVSPESPWENGPGKSGVRIIWPFGIRCCGSCLQDVSKKVLNTTRGSNKR